MLSLRVRDFRQQSLIFILIVLADAALADGLRDALQAALRNHPAVSGQQAQVEAKRNVVGQARSLRLPTLSARGRSEGDLSMASSDDSSEPSLIRARQPIWSFGRIRNDIAVANAEMSTQQADLLRVQRELIELTAVAYAQVRGSDEQISIATRNVSEHQALLEQIERRMAGQLATSADTRLAATRLLQAKVTLERAISDFDVAENDLRGYTQIRVAANEPVASALFEVPEQDELFAWAIENNADVLVKKVQLDQATAEVEKAKTSTMPTVYLQADKYYNQLEERDDEQVSLVFEASLDGLGFAYKGRRGEADASRMAAAEDLKLAKVDTRRDLEQLQRKRQLQAQLIELQAQSVTDLETLLASYQRQYESGAKSWLDLMNMQRELFEQRRALTQSRIEWAVYSLQLQSRVGGLDQLAELQVADED